MQPILNDIAGSVPTWDKVASGMVKMYEAEVLQKFPVIQVRQTIPIGIKFAAVIPPVCAVMICREVSG